MNDRERAGFNMHYGKSLSLHAFPRAEDVPGQSEAMRRRWIIRALSTLPIETDLQRKVGDMQEQVKRRIVDTYGEQVQLRESIPALHATRLDDLHLVLTIDCPTPEALMADAATIATVLGLQLADAEWGIDDLQGIPKRYWFFLGH